MEYDDGRDKRHSGDGVEREPNMLQVDRVVRLVARAEIVKTFIGWDCENFFWLRLWKLLSAEIVKTFIGSDCEFLDSK